MTFNRIRDHAYNETDNDPEALTVHDERVAQLQADSVAKKLSWRVVAAVSGAFLVIATAWITTVSSVTWQLSRNCDVVQSRLSSLEDTSKANAVAIANLQNYIAGLPSRDQLEGVLASATQLHSYISGDAQQMTDLHKDVDEMKKQLLLLGADLLTHKQLDLKLIPQQPQQPAYPSYRR